MIEVVNTLEDVLEPYAGQIVNCEKDGKVYRWDPVEGWELFKFNGDISMTAYEINKQIIGQLQIIDEEVLNEKKSLIRDFVSEQHNQFHMLLCRDINYYTVFAIEKKLADECIEDVVIECANDIGSIKAIDLTEDKNAIEIWVSNNSNETYVLYFFPYDNGVIICG